MWNINKKIEQHNVCSIMVWHACVPGLWCIRCTVLRRAPTELHQITSPAWCVRDRRRVWPLGHLSEPDSPTPLRGNAPYNFPTIILTIFPSSLAYSPWPVISSSILLNAWSCSSSQSSLSYFFNISFTS